MMEGKNDHLLGGHQIDQLLTKIRPNACQPKSYKTDPDRLLYSQLLEFSTRHLQTLQKDIANTSNVRASPLQHLASNLFNPLFEEIIDLSKRECGQKAYLLKMVYDFYHSAIVAIQKQSQEKTRSFIAEYTCKLDQKESQFQKEKEELNQKIKQVQEENDSKWKTFYMIVRDNRVLRRQKGKLLRTLQQERIKHVKTHQELMLLARENEKYKLLANYQQQESLAVFLNNQKALGKMEQFMKEYPKRAKKVLLFNLKELEIMEQKALDSKIDYILKAVRQAEEIFDEYEDLADVAPQNKILCNAEVQTDQEEQEEIPKTTVAYVQTNQQILKLVNKQLSYCFGHRHIENQRRRRDVVGLNGAVQIQQAARQFSKEKLHLQKRVYSLRIYQKFSVIKRLVLCEQTINQNIVIDWDELVPKSTLQRLITSNRRSRQFYNKRQSQSSRGSAVFKKMVNSIGTGKETTQVMQKAKYRNSIQTSGKLENGEYGQQQSKKIIVSIKRTSTNKLHYSKQMVQTEPTQKMQPTQIKQQYHDQIQYDKEQNGLHDMHDVQRDSAITSMSLLKGSKKTILTNDKKENNLIVRKTGTKKRTMFRMSGFAANSNSKKSLTQQQESRMTLKMSVEGMDSRNSEARLCLFNNHDNTYPPKSNSNISIFGNDRANRQTVNQKHINLLGQQSSMLVQKLMKAIYLKRNEIADGKMTFEHFLSEYMTNHYGPQIKVFFASRITARSDYDNPLVKTFDILLSNYHTQAYLKYVFGLFGKLILMNNSSSIYVQEEKGYTLKNELLRNTIGQDVCDREDDQNCGNICSIFMDLQNRVNTMLKQCELYTFLKEVFPHSQKFLLFQELKQMFSVLLGQKEHFQCLRLLRHYCKNDLTPIMLCAYAFRQKWTKVINFKTTIESKYHRWFGQFSLQKANLIVQRVQHSERLSWSYNLLFSQLKTQKPNVFILKYLCVLFTANQMEKQLPISPLLNDLSNQYCLSYVKKYDQSNARNI